MLALQNAGEQAWTDLRSRKENSHASRRSNACPARLPQGIDVTDFNATTVGQRIVDDGRLAGLVQVLNNPAYRLGLDDVEPDILGRAYEYLLQRFSEGQGQSAGEFYTPREVAIVMAHLLDPQSATRVFAINDSPTSKHGFTCLLRVEYVNQKFSIVRAIHTYSCDSPQRWDRLVPI
jgi:hypothetical protein